MTSNVESAIVAYVNWVGALVRWVRLYPI